MTTDISGSIQLLTQLIIDHTESKTFAKTLQLLAKLLGKLSINSTLQQLKKLLAFLGCLEPFSCSGSNNNLI